MNLLIVTSFYGFWRLVLCISGCINLDSAKCKLVYYMLPVLWVRRVLSLGESFQVEVEFENGGLYKLSAEYLRIYSPAVDSKIRSICGEKVTRGTLFSFFLLGYSLCNLWKRRCMSYWQRSSINKPGLVCFGCSLTLVCELIALFCVFQFMFLCIRSYLVGVMSELCLQNLLEIMEWGNKSEQIFVSLTM